MYARILIGTDGSSSAEHALRHAALLAKNMSSKVRIVHVVDMGLLPIGPEVAIDTEARTRARRDAGERILAAARATAESCGVDAETRLLETETPLQRVASLIVDEAASWPADVVVLGTHGRRGVERLLLGGVADGVARLARTPVLLVPHE